MLGGLNDFADGIERASKRQFDDEPGGGVFDPDTYTGEEAPGSDAEVPEEEGIATQPESERGGGPATSLLGSLPRQFDDREGGGFADEAADQAGDAAGDAVSTLSLEAKIGLGLVVLVVVLAAARPGLEIGANLTE